MAKQKKSTGSKSLLDVMGKLMLYLFFGDEDIKYLKEKRENFQKEKKKYEETSRKLKEEAEIKDREFLKQWTKSPTPTSTPTPTPIPFPIPTVPPKYPTEPPIHQEYQDFLSQFVFPITKKSNIPEAVVSSQWATEGGRALDNPLHNVFGLGPGVQYPSIERNVEDYASTVKNILGKKGYNINDTTDAFDILLKLQEGKKPRYEGHNPDPYEYIRTLINTPEWRYYYK